MICFHKTKKAIRPLILVPILATAFSLTSCSIQRSSQYYWPTVAQTFPPKAETVRVPILEKAPKRPYVVIGKMALKMDTDEMDALYKKLQYNARRNGADAVILKLTRSKDPNSTELHADANMIVFR